MTFAPPTTAQIVITGVAKPHIVAVVVTRLHFAHVTVDCHDADRLVAFWRPLIGSDREPVRQGLFVYMAWEGPGSLCFQEVPEAKMVKNREHLDFTVADLEAATAMVLELGGQLIREVTEGDDSWRVFGDPEGNEFCIAEVPGP